LSAADCLQIWLQYLAVAQHLL